MTNNRLPHNWHDTTLYSQERNDRIPPAAWLWSAIVIAIGIAVLHIGAAVGF